MTERSSTSGWSTRRVLARPCLQTRPGWTDETDGLREAAHHLLSPLRLKHVVPQSLGQLLVTLDGEVEAVVSEEGHVDLPIREARRVGVFQQRLKNDGEVVLEETSAVQQRLESPSMCIEEDVNCTWKSRFTSTSSWSSGDAAAGSMRHEQNDLWSRHPGVGFCTSLRVCIGSIWTMFTIIRGT